MLCDESMSFHLSTQAWSILSSVMRSSDQWWNSFLKSATLVDTIGNCKTRDASLASCMLELIRTARMMSQISLDLNDNIDFWIHAKQVFNRRFHAMNTNYHSLTLYLHPMCRKLPISQAARFYWRYLCVRQVIKRWAMGYPGSIIIRRHRGTIVTTSNCATPIDTRQMWIRSH